MHKLQRGKLCACSTFSLVMLFMFMLLNINDLVKVHGSAVASDHDRSYSNFDDLRSQGTEDGGSWLWMSNHQSSSSPNSTSNSTSNPTPQARSNVLKLEHSETNEDLRLADITAFLPFSESAKQIRSGVHNDAAVALLATQHFNDRSDVVARETGEDTADTTSVLEGCDLYLTLDIVDSQFSPIESTRLFTQEILQREHSLREPLPAAVVGAYRSATTSPLAILTGVNEIPQVSYSSTATDFDVKEQYPWFGRTIGSSIQEALAALKLFKSWNATHVSVLFVTDAYGSALQKAFQDAATQHGIETDSVAFSDSASSLEIANAIQNLKETQYRAIYAICFETHYPKIMTAAYEEGLTGGDFVWIFPGFDTTSFLPQLAYPKDSPLALASPGVGILQYSGGITPEPWLPDTVRMPPLQEPPRNGYERFRTAWRSSLDDEDWKAYVRSKYPASLSREGGVPGWDPQAEFALEPTIQSHFIYDAVWSLGIAMCQVSTENNDTSADGFIAGPEIYEHFLELEFEGATGPLTIDDRTGTRESHPFVLNNVRSYMKEETETVSNEGTARFAIYPSQVLEDGSWTTVNQFIFADGGTVPPDSLPPVDHDRNYIGTTGRIIGYTLMGIVIATSLCSWGWLFIRRKERVVRSSQPTFLFLISLGSMVMATSILPMGMEESMIQGDAATQHSALDKSCQAFPWLYLTGAAIAFAALFAKTRATYQAYANPTLDFIVVTTSEIITTLVILLAVNWAVLITWTLKAPLEWERRFGEGTDTFGRPVESYGICTNDGAFAYVILLVVINLGLLVLANYWAYKSRNIETEYHESRYIAIAMASVLQAWCMGIPIFIMVWETPQAKFFVSTGIVFVTSAAVLGLIFVPKVIAIAQDRRLIAAEEKKKAFQEFSNRKSKEVEARWFDTREHQQRNSGGLSTDAAVAALAIHSAETESPHRSDICFEAQEDSADLADLTLPSQELPSARHHESKRENRTTETTASNPPESSPSNDECNRTQNGIKVIHNPRSPQVLELSNGHEMSREQLENYRSGQSFDDMSGDNDSDSDVKMRGRDVIKDVISE